MLIIYDILLVIFALFYLPFAVFKGKFKRDFILRLGMLPRNIKFSRPIWLHAVSVGEILSSKPLLAKIRQLYPDRQIVISTITSTGNKIAQGLIQDKDFVFYLPLDLSFIVRRVIKRINPAVCIILETEIWPNVISCLNKEGIPIALVNARISDKSYGKYKLVRFIFKPILGKINIFCVQSKTDAERFISLGVDEDKVKVAGNMKFDIQKTDSVRQGTDLTFSEKDKLIVAGSTHPGEEEIVLRVYKKLLAESSDLKLLIAPRHPERAKEIAGLVSMYNFTPVLVSGFRARAQQAQANPVFILDTVGQLASLYALATVVFVGGSLVKKGGHNVIEPAYFSKAIIVGPYMHNFNDITDCFLKTNALVMVNNENEFKNSLELLLKNDAKRNSLGENAYKLIQTQQGAVQKNLEQISIFLKA